MKFILNKVDMHWRCMWSMDSSRTCDCIPIDYKEHYIDSMLAKPKVIVKVGLA